MSKPLENEYALYYKTYINKVVDENPIKTLEDEKNSMLELLNSVSEEKGNFAYQEGKWTLKEVVGHIIDTEFVMMYRALCIARGETQSLPGFEQDDYNKNSNYTKLTLVELKEIFNNIRETSISLLKSLDKEAFSKSGVANGKNVTVNALAYIIAGHGIHHKNVIKEKYLN